MSTPSRDPEEGPDSQHAPSSEPAVAPGTEAPAGTTAPEAPTANEPAETQFDTPAVTDHEDMAAEREPSGALAPEEMAFAHDTRDTEEPADTPAVEETRSDMPVVTEPVVADEPAFDTLGGEEPAYDTLGPEEPTFDTFAPEDPQVAEAIHEAAPIWPPLVQKLTLGQAIVIVAGVLLFIWGFLAWYSDAGGHVTAWGTVTIPGLLPTATWVPLLSLAIALFVAIKVFANGFPDTVLGFTWAQLAMVVGFIDVLISFGLLVANRRLGNLGSLDLGPGLILSFITSLVLLAGAVLDHLGRGSDFFRGGSQRRVASPGAGGPAAPAA
jgi:hypothetical protein